MFHVFLALPALAAFGALAGIVLGLMGALLALAFFGEMVLCLLCKRVWWDLSCAFWRDCPCPWERSSCSGAFTRSWPCAAGRSPGF